MPIIEINDLSHPGVEVYGRLTEAQLRNRLDPGRGIFVAESPKVIAVALNAGYEPLSLLCERRHITGDAAPLIARCGDLPVYTGEREVLAKLTGYTLTRGVLCAMRRPAPPDLESVCHGAARVAVMDGVVDSTNVGAIFRSAAALGVDAVLTTPTCCDPFNRRVVRVSMGSVFLVPWTWLDGGVEKLHELGFQTVAMALTDSHAWPSYWGRRATACRRKPSHNATTRPASPWRTAWTPSTLPPQQPLPSGSCGKGRK